MKNRLIVLGLLIVFVVNFSLAQAAAYSIGHDKYHRYLNMLYCNICDKETLIGSCEESQRFFVKLKYNDLNGVSSIKEVLQIIRDDKVLQDNKLDLQADISCGYKFPLVTSLTIINSHLTDLVSIDNIPSLTFLDIRYNNLDLSDGSGTRAIIDTLQDRGVTVLYKPQGNLDSRERGYLELYYDYEGDAKILNGMINELYPTNFAKQISSILAEVSPLYDMSNLDYRIKVEEEVVSYLVAHE